MVKTKKDNKATSLSKVTGKAQKTSSAKKDAAGPVERITSIASVLKKYASKKAEESTDLLADDSKRPIFLQINLNKSVEKAQLKPFVIDLPHPLYKDGDHEVCLIVRNPQRLWKDKVASDEKIANLITKVIDFEHLRKKFPLPENKRALMNDFDVFFADQKLVHLIPGQLGRHFRKAKKLPIGLPLKTTKDVHSVIRPALSQTAMMLKPGSTTSIKIAHLSDSPSAIAENSLAALKKIEEHLKTLSTTDEVWKMNTVLLHLSGSVSLPILQTDKSE